MTYKDFEDYMQTVHAKQYHGTDDDMIDDYEDWIDSISVDEWIEYGTQYGEAIKKELRKESV